MPTKRELYNYLDSIIPRNLSCEWDNDGFMCCSDPESEVKSILFALDATEETVDYAIAKGFDTIITHHPFIFKGDFKSITTDEVIARKIIKVIKSDTAVMSFHTRLDTVAGGVNDALADALCLTEVTSYNVHGQDMGRVGFLPHEMNSDELAMYIKEKLGSQFVNYNGQKNKIKKLAVLGGSGKGDIVHAAAQTGADAYLTGEIGNSPLTYPEEFNINCYEAGHYYTEYPVLKKLSHTINSKFPNIIFEIHTSHSAKTV